MGFTTCVFIRKNTPELRDKLEEFGYKILSPLFDKGENLIAGYSLYSNYCAFKNSDLNWFIDNVKPIDCNQNEELFLAIAALRDDSDNNQWFTDSLGYWQNVLAHSSFHIMQN